jgi:hypothetical protein
MKRGGEYDEVYRKQFYQRYFSATQDASWLARLMAGRQQKILGELMQWELRHRPLIIDLQTSCVTEYWCILILFQTQASC